MAIKKDPRSRWQCGSNAGYRQHVKRGERACAACKRAHAEEQYARRHGLEIPKSPKRRTARDIRREQDELFSKLMAMTDREYERFVRGEDFE